MYLLTVANFKGDTLVLTQDESNYQVINIVGLNPPPAQINTTTGVNLDGAAFNSSRLNTRNIVITVKINGDVETNRQNLYRFFPTKQPCTIYYLNENRNVFIMGYVETVECNLFTNNEQMQISIICPQPYFKGLYEMLDDISNRVAQFVFPFSINVGSPIPFSTYQSSRITNVYNDSDSESGMIIVITFFDGVNSIMIRDVDNGDTFTLNYSFLENDVVIVNTSRGEKSVTLLRDGTTTNIFSAVQKGSVFLQLTAGDNHFGYIADNGSNDDGVTIVIKHRNLYRGV